MRAAAAFLNGLFDAERDLWYPILVVVDEAQLFAPAAAGDVSEEARKATLGAMANLMCRGRKRGLAGVIATQRLAKLAKNVAAEASNFLMGRTFLDIDMARAADLLGLERRQAEMFRDLGRGRFVALGPALSRRPIEIRIGAVETGARSTSPKLLPMPETPPEDVHELIFKAAGSEPPMPRPTRPPPQPQQSTAELLAQLIRSRPDTAPAPEEEPDAMTQAERDAAIDAVLRDLVAAEIRRSARSRCCTRISWCAAGSSGSAAAAPRRSTSPASAAGWPWPGPGSTPTRRRARPGSTRPGWRGSCRRTCRASSCCWSRRRWPAPPARPTPPSPAPTAPSRSAAPGACCPIWSSATSSSAAPPAAAATASWRCRSWAARPPPATRMRGRSGEDRGRSRRCRGRRGSRHGGRDRNGAAPLLRGCAP